MIAVAGQAGDRPRHTVHELSYGWVRYGSDLVHHADLVILRGPRGTVGRADPALRAVLPRDERQNELIHLNREDLLTWLADRGALAGAVLELASGPGWQQVTDSRGGTRWIWNTPRDPALKLPPGLTRGSASGYGMRCLLDSLRQLPGRLAR